MSTTPSPLITLNVIAAPAAPAIGKPGDSCPPLPKIVDAAAAVWTFNAATHQIFRNGVDTKQPFADTDRVYLNLGNVAWLHSADHGYLYWNGSAWGFSGHGPDGGFF